MVRVMLGSAVAAVAMLVVGFLIHATPLSSLGSGSLENDRAAQLQAALKTNLPKTGTYQVPDPDTAEQTTLYGTGPVATIHYNASGHAADDAGMFLPGFILNFAVTFLIGFGLMTLGSRVPDFATRARIVIPFAFAAAVFIHVGRPIYMHHDWGNAIFSTLADGLALAIGGLIVAWFLPHHDRKLPAFRASELRESGE